MNMLGDVVNVGLTTILVEVIVGPPFALAWPPQGGPLHFMRISAFILYVPLEAELVRVLVERVLIVWSVLWQLLPHRKVARAILAREHSSTGWRWLARCFPRYCRYYVLSDAERMAYVLCALKRRAAPDRELAERLEYVQALRIMPQEHGLRSGYVRDVARGEVFIHAIWTNDPWLLVGMVIRRAPWMFDPRYVRRPFYYMTEVNVLATQLVLERARYCLPYALFQCGHEIRVARLHFFYGVLRWLGMDVEYHITGMRFVVLNVSTNH
jgi:hypothetical protein